MKYLIIILTLGSIGCAGNQIRTLNTDLDVKSGSDQGDIGLKDKIAIIQKEIHADDELRTQRWRNNRAEDELSNSWFMLKMCREDQADSRLGGTGEIEPLQEIDNMKQISDLKEEFGIVNGNLKFVTHEDFLKRIAIERKYADSLVGMKKEVNRSREKCELKLGVQRVKAGLPAHRNGSQTLDRELSLIKKAE